MTQPELFMAASDLDNQILSSLDSTEALLDWPKIESLLAPIYATNTGRPSYPLLTLFRSLLLGIWYKLSDVQLAQSLYRDLLFRKFCHLELTSSVPEASTLGRFRNQLVKLELWDILLAEVNNQLESKNIIMREGRINIIDATPIEAAQSGSGNGKEGTPKKDPEAGWQVGMLAC
ncbi:transposase [Marinomonas primoryensis]|uniref:transposase n=1 Tax=Marinomonas primoryensis TaxID=178399 RepID=UPI003703A944